MSSDIYTPSQRVAILRAMAAHCTALADGVVRAAA